MDARLHRRRGGGLSFLMGGDGPPLLLLHGTPGSAQAWSKVGTRIANRFRVIIPDLMGFGASDPPESDYYLSDQAQAVRNLLNHLRITDLYLGGHDFGGALAVTLMKRYPELRVRGLILSAANLFTDTHMPPRLRVAKVPGLRNLFFWGMVGNRVGLRSFYESAVYNKEEMSWRDFRVHLTRPSIALTRRIFQRSLTDLKHNYAAVEEYLPQIDCPALVLWGDDDPFLGVDVGERLSVVLPDAVLKVYAYTGHFVPEERPIETAEDIILRFMNEPAPSLLPFH